ERGPAEKVDAAALGRMIDVNLKAPVVLSRLAIPYLRKAGGGAIINVASLAGRTPVPGAATYSASKFGLRAFTYALGDELAGSGIKVAVVSPGPIDTGFIMSDIDAVADITFSQPLSTAQDVAEAIMQLAVNERREQSMPSSSGFLTTASYLFPGLGRALRPALNRKGRKIKERLKASLREEARKNPCYLFGCGERRPREVFAAVFEHSHVVFDADAGKRSHSVDPVLVHHGVTG